MKKDLFLIIVTFLSVTVFAKTTFNGVSFQVVQHSSSLDDVSDISYVFEDEILNGFFERGIIATNTPVARSNKTNDKKIWGEGLNDAKESRFNAFLQINLYYKDGVTNSKLARLSLLDSVEWSLVDATNGKSIGSERKRVTPPTQKDSEEVLRNMARDVFFDIYKRLNNKGGRL